MFFWSIVLLTLAATSDSFIIGFNYGVKGVRINYISNIFISVVCFVGTFLSMLMGSSLGTITQAGAERIGGAILLSLGLYMLIGCFRKSDSMENPDGVDKDNSKVIELRESVTIGLLLAMNNVGIGIGAGFAGLPILATSALCAAASFGFISVGFLAGRRMQRMRLGRWLEVASAVLVLFLGVLELLS